MKIICFLIATVLLACNENVQHPATGASDSILQKTDSPDKKKNEKQANAPVPKIYSNQRFKDVTVEKTGQHEFTIQGKGQIFEANFGWVVEDGHQELKKGFQMTDAGAPEWGKFRFTVDVQKQRPNSTLTLILFESSAKDGSRQFELPIVLE